ncbi:MAG TPA: hypothetical protein VK465_06735, partial [Fibrobacteria bacterium]|nr:hypothetical protein [Fibrobacteria bacterium]
MAGHLEMWFNTSNRTQLNLDGLNTGAFSVHNNYFANPPVRNMVAEAGGSRYPVFVKPGSYQADKSLAVENVRYPAWDGFTNSLPTTLFGVTNETTPAARDAAVTWDWRIPSETKYGAWNGNIPLPTFDLFPTDTSMNLPIPGGRATVLPAPFPRQARFSLKAIPQYYSTRVPDSVRSWFQKDTLLALDGKVAVLHLTLPNREEGTPILVVPTNEGFRAGAPGPRGSTQYRNFQLKAQEFIPALGGQNTFTGKTVVSTDSLRPDIFMAFSSVTRAGMTTIGSTQLRHSNRKWRLPHHQGQVVAFSASTTAEVGGTFNIGVPVAGTTAFMKDSLFFWRGGDVFLPVKDSSGKFMAAVPPPLGKMDAILIERMTFGPGVDTLNLPQARIFAKSTAGYQMIAEPVPAPDDPYMGAFGAVLKFSWPGRLSGDSLFAQFPRSDPLQQVWIRKGNESLLLPVLPGDSRTMRVALGIGDSNKVIFVARKFGIPAGRPVNLISGQDSILGLTARRPGELTLDVGFRPTNLDTTRLIILAARGIRMDSLVPQGPYTLSLVAKPAKTRDLVRALVSINGIWEATAFRENGGRYAITMPPTARAVMMVEFASAADWAPAQPAATAAMSIQGDSLVFTPGLTPAERAALPLYRADLLSLGSDGNLRVESSRYVSVESPLSVGLVPDRLYAYRVVYRSPFDRFSPDLAWIPLAGKQPDLAAITARLPVRKAMFRHLVGFPFDGATLGANVKAGMVAGAGDILALDTIVSGKWAGLAVGDGTRLERGKGYLLGADQPFQVKAEGAVFSGLKPDTLRLNEPGWHLIANPLPFPFPRTALGIPDSTALSFPRALRRLDTTTGSPAVYDWPVPDTLQPFEGYLIYVFKPTYLAFDPYSAANRDGLDAASGAPSPVIAAVKRAAPKLSASTSTPSALRMILSGPGGSQSAVFFRSGPFLQTPYMRPFSERGRVLEFRAGDGAGWVYRKVDRMDSLRIPIEVIAPEAGTYSLDLSGGDAGGNGSGRSAALLDMGSGKVYHVAEMGALPLAAGRNAFVLLHGKAAAPGIADFSAGLPTEFALDQNTPNPFRGSTRVRFRVPGGPDGLFRGRFRVTSSDG